MSGGLEAVYREHGADLWRAVLAYAGDRAVADEAVAEAFAQAGPRLGEIRSPKAWLYRAAFRIAAGELKRRRAFEPLREEYAISGGGSADQAGGNVMDLLRTLSPNQRGVVVLRQVFGYPTVEVARILCLSEVAVRVHLHAARRRLRDALKQAEEV